MPDTKALDMQSFSDVNLIAIPLNLFEFMGETKAVTSIRLILFRIFNYSVVALVLFFLIINLYFAEGVYYVRTTESIFFLSQFLLKYLLLIKHKPTIRLVLANIQAMFWDYRDFGGSLVATNEQIYKTAKFIQTLMLSTCLSVLYFYFLRPLFVSTSRMPLESYVPRSEAWDAAIWLSQLYCSFLSILIVVGYDCIYVATSIHLVLQLRMLKQRIQLSLDQHKEDRCKLEICSYIQHHQFLYSMFLQMKEIYSAMLLYHYMATLISTCSISLELILKHTDFMNFLAQMLSMIFLIMQFAMYTFPAEQLAFEFSDLADAIYFSKWYRNDADVQKVILYVMMKAQRQQYFTGAGLIDVNVRTFESVVRKSFSFCAIFRNLFRN